MIILWLSYGFGVFPVYDFDAVLDTISIRLRGKARLGKKHGCKSENHTKNLANTSKPVLWEAGDVSKSYQNRIKIVTKSYQNRIHILNHIKIVTGRILEIVSKS